MKLLLNLAWVLFLFSPIYAQIDQTIEHIEETAQRIEVITYTLDKESTDSSLFIKMSFEEFGVTNQAMLQTAELGQISQVDLVYTLYPFGKDFSLLNRNRIRALLNLFPNLLDEKNITWRYIGQSKGKTRVEAAKMFHGLVIYHQQEIKSPSPTALLTTPLDSSDLDKKSAISLDKKLEKIEAIPSAEFDYNSPDGLQTILNTSYIPRDSSVYQILERNANEWEKVLVVADWTGSMYPFGMQLLVWLKQHSQNQSKFKEFVFFNDGDSKRLGEKVIGRTGGVYHSPSTNFEDILNTMLETQSGGFGGDGPENDLEALLRGQSVCPDCKEILLIAESQSQVRDLILLKQLAERCRANGQIVRIILCGTEEGIVEDYLAIALATQGSLHTAQEDLKGLDQIKLGDQIELNGTVYELGSEGLRFIEKKGKFKKK